MIREGECGDDAVWEEEVRRQNGGGRNDDQVD
jgi:hypothetical protein